MRFLRHIIRKTSDPLPQVPLRRNPDTSERPCKVRTVGVPKPVSTPKFSRQANAIMRTRKLADAPDRTLGDLLHQWKKETQPNDFEPVDETTIEPVQTAATQRPTRAKTRLLGFDDVAAPDYFAKTKPVPKAATTRYPVGWLVIIDGPGRGESYTLLTGMSQIGRGSDQAVVLDFGDEAISRSNHAAIVYDIETHSLLLGHGGKANVVRVNGQPLITTQLLKSGDVIRIGETVMQLVVFSTPDQNWAAPQVPEVDDVATS